MDSPSAVWLERQSAALRDAFRWLREMPPSPPDGITELRRAVMFVNVHGYTTLPRPDCRWESHRHTADIQFCISGGEIIDWRPFAKLARTGSYDEEKDTEHWADDSAPASHLRMTSGAFVLFRPGELHRPKVSDGLNARVAKLVIKIDASILDGQ